MKKIFSLLILIILITSTANAQSLGLNQYKDKVIYLDFWASWCAPCKESFPWLNKITKKHKDLVVIGINLDKEQKDAEAFLKKYPADFKIIFNSSASLAKNYKVKGMPYSILIDKKGHIRHQHIGFSKDKSKNYTDKIELLLGEN